jgi:hypothetical protein
MALELDVFLKPDQLPAAYLLPNRVRFDLGTPYKVEITWGQTRGRVPVLLGDRQTGFEMYAGAMTKSDTRDEEIPAAATNAGRTYRVNLVWRRPLEGAAAYAFAAAVAKMKSGYILDGQTNVRLKPDDAYGVARTLMAEEDRQARKAAAPKPRVRVETEQEHEAFLRRHVVPLLGDGWVARGAYLVRVPIGPILFAVDVSLDPSPKVEGRAFATPLYVPRYGESDISTYELGMRETIFEAKAPARADEAAVARKLAGLVKSRAPKWFARVETPLLVSERIAAAGDETPGDTLPNSLILAGRYDEAREPLERATEYHKPHAGCPKLDRVAHKQRVELRRALQKSPAAARKLLMQLARENAKTVGVAKWFRPRRI